MDALTSFAHPTLAFLGFGFQELLLVAFVALLVFGGNLPDVMRQLGRTYGKFRQSLHELSQPVRDEMRQVRQVSPPQRTPASYSEDVPDAEGDADADATSANHPGSDPDSVLEEGRGHAEEGADAGGIPRGGVSPGEAQSPDDGTSDEDDDDDDDEPPPV